MGGTLLRPLPKREHCVTSALEAVECLPTMEKLVTEPTLEELSKAIGSLASGKALDSDGIPDLTKHYKIALLHSLRVALCQCWQEGAVPQDTRDAKIITLSKNKGERATATITEASPFSASLAKSLRRSS